MFSCKKSKCLWILIFFLTTAAQASVMSTVELFALLDYRTTPQKIEDAIRKGANVNAKGENDWTALMIVARDNKNPEVLSVLIKAGADVNAKQSDGLTPLMFAALSENTNILSILIKAGADVNAQDNNGWTPLIWAASRDPNAVSILLDAGADARIKDYRGLRAINHAVNNDKLKGTTVYQRIHAATDMVQMTLHDLCFLGTLEEVEAALRNGADVNYKGLNGMTALMWAAESCRPDLVSAFIKAGADVHARCDKGATPLQHATFASSP